MTPPAGRAVVRPPGRFPRLLDAVGPTRSTHHVAGWRVRTRLDVSVLGGLGTVDGVRAG